MYCKKYWKIKETQWGTWDLRRSLALTYVLWIENIGEITLIDIPLGIDKETWDKMSFSDRVLLLKEASKEALPITLLATNGKTIGIAFNLPNEYFSRKFRAKRK